MQVSYNGGYLQNPKFDQFDIETHGFGDPHVKKPPYIDQKHENVNVDRDYSDLQCFVLCACVCVCAKRVKDNSHVSRDCALKMGSPGLFAKGVNI